MSMKHLALLGASLASIGAMGAGAHEWAEVLSPQFVFGALAAIGTTITALYTDRPNG